MAKVFIEETTLTAIGDAIREKEGTTELVPVIDMANRISAISGGGGIQQEWFNDGNTHIWISLAEGRTSPTLGFKLNPSTAIATVDWGDGTAPEEIKGKGAKSTVYTTHDYAAPDDYIITITTDGDLRFQGASSSVNTESGILLSYSQTLIYWTNESDWRSRTYRAAIKKVEYGNASTQMYGSGFGNCYSLTKVLASQSITSIASKAFDGCGGMKCYDFTRCTAVPSLANVDAFNGIPADCEILVPSALYNEWVAATNWATYASHIKAV